MIKIKNFLALLLVLFSVYSYAQLQAYEPNLYGKYEITAGAKGSNNRPDYLYINKPAGATTVYKIYMYNAGTGTGGAVPSNIVTVDGVAYALPNLKTANQVANGTVGAATYKGYSGQVAGAMKTKLDNATAGTVITFSVDEGPQTSDTDGVGIIVIWNNPTKNAGSHFVYIGMDMIVGGAGTTINIPVSPIDKTIPGYEPILGIGINYSTGICDAYSGGGCQLATIKVNGNKITDNAGGYDDGSNNNGALITLGGYGDDPNNNDADELYNIKDQLTNGATNLQFNFKDYSGDVDDVVNAIYFSGVGVTPPACALAPPVTATPISNICPATTVDLDNQGHTGIIPVGASLYWFTNNTHTGTRLTGTQVTEAGAGTYYAFYYDSVNGCYSPASSAVTVTINACNYCVSGDCNPNTFLNTSDPNTIEYDNMVSVFHSTMVRESNGDVKVWGQGAAENGTQSSGNRSTPGLITNYGTGANKLTGKILKFAMGGGLDATSTQAQQFGVLTENGLYFWGDQGLLVPLGAGNNITTGAFRKATAATYGVAGNKADGLPAGVSPTDVKMMFGTYKTLAIVTCSGQAWVMSSYASYYGDGNSGGAMWHQVSTSAGVPLENVVAVRGTNYDNALFALTSTGDLYTWGNKTYLGGSGAGETLASRTFATLMIKPAGVTPKMIGAVQNSNGPTYYLLATDGRLFALGSNQNFNFADNTQTDSDTWKEITGSQTINGTTYTLGGNIAWISPNEHYQQGRGMNLLTTDAKLWAWGTNSSSMFGGTASRYDTPEYMPGRTTGAYDATKLNLTDRVLAVETGGHTSITVKGCANRYGYVGHRVRGSMGDGTTVDFTETIYNFAQTGILSICGATTVPDVKDIKKCAAATADLANAQPILPPNTTIEWWLDAAGTIPVPNPAAVQAGVYYASFGGIADKCIKQITVSNYVATDPEYATCAPPNYCVTGCNDNTYLNASDPNTIEYDNMVSGLHATIVKEEDGTYKIWGENANSINAGNLLVPTVIGPSAIAEENFTYTGTILKATLGSTFVTLAGKPRPHQFAILTTDGLYVWGVPGALISTGIKNTTAFSKISVNGKTDGLPAGVAPADVKMMFGSDGTLAIVTCTGEAWVLSTKGEKNGDGTVQNTANDKIWHRVKTSSAATLNNVVAMRGTPRALFALTSDNKLYTWGSETYINSGAAANRTYATAVTMPAGVTPKMIGMSQLAYAFSAGVTSYFQSYYLLATDGRLYAMGNNQRKELGDGTTTTRTTWIQPQKPAAQGQGTGALVDIVWISPNEHDGAGFAGINVLTNTKKVWAWGANSGYMLGAPTNAGSVLTDGVDPTYMPGTSSNADGLKSTDNLIAIETGGHTTINVKECTNQYGYVGHRAEGSMGNGNFPTWTGVNAFSYSTAILQLCGAPVPPPVYNLKKCASSTADLNSAVSAAMSGSGYTIEWYMADGVTPVANPAAVGAGSYVAKYITSNPLLCSGKTETITVADYTVADAEFTSCTPAFVCPPDPYKAQQTWWLPEGRAGFGLTGGNVVRIDFQSGSAVLNNPADGVFGQNSTIGSLGGEGNTAVTNPVTGDLLFVTDGNSIFKYDGTKASGPGVGGNASAEEAAGAIPDPQGVLGRDFIIFGNSSNNLAGTLSMGKYNLETNVVSNVTTLLPASSIYEALEIIPHTNGNDYWILVNTTDQKVKSYLYTKANGFDATPVSSIDVPNLPGGNSAVISVSSFISWDPRNPGTLLIGRHDKLGLSSFDPATGAIGDWSIKISTPPPGGAPSADIYNIYSKTGYSAALSANGKYIYYSPTTSNGLYYYNIATGVSYQIGSSSADIQGIKLAPDGRLYVVSNISSGSTYNRYLQYYTTPDTPPATNSTTLLPTFYQSGRFFAIQLPNNVYWGCMTCQSGTAAPALANTNISPAPATVGALIAQLSASNMPAGTAITIHTGATATDANKLASTAAIVPGTTYYVAFYDGLAVCYSPTTAVTVAAACFNDPATGGTNHDTKMGITLLKRAGAENADNWPMVRKSGHIALESNTQGFVVTRMTTAQLTAIKDANNAVEGMMSYDTDAQCLKIYDGTDWKCFSTPSCP